jgi:hypothetical protein
VAHPITRTPVHMRTVAIPTIATHHRYPPSLPTIATHIRYPLSLSHTRLPTLAVPHSLTHSRLPTLAYPHSLSHTRYPLSLCPTLATHTRCPILGAVCGLATAIWRIGRPREAAPPAQALVTDIEDSLRDSEESPQKRSEISREISREVAQGKPSAIAASRAMEEEQRARKR